MHSSRSLLPLPLRLLGLSLWIFAALAVRAEEATQYKEAEFVSYHSVDGQLKPSGAYTGKVRIPTNWFVLPGNGYYYEFVPEKKAMREPDTHLWIAMFSAPSRRGEETAEALMADLRKRAVKILREIPEHDYGEYRRIGLETLTVEPMLDVDKYYHNFYYYWWKKSGDLTISTAFRCRDNEWAKYEDIFWTMCGLQIQSTKQK